MGVESKHPSNALRTIFYSLSGNGLHLYLSSFFSADKEKDALRELDQWIEKYGGVDAVIDGANVGYFNQRPDLGGVLDYNQIDRVLQACIARGWRRSVVFLHSKRSENPKVCEENMFYHLHQTHSSILSMRLRFVTRFSSARRGEMQTHCIQPP